MTRTLAGRIALLAAPALVLAACSSGPEDAAPSASPTPSPSASASASASPSPSATQDSPDRIFVVLCDPAAKESVAAIEAVMDPEFTLSQVIDVRTDDEGVHAVMGYVQGPGLAVLATWTGVGMELADLAAADDFAQQVTDVPAATPNKRTKRLLKQTVGCYTKIYLPESDQG
jgi:hypothetical protein